MTAPMDNRVPGLLVKNDGQCPPVSCSATSSGHPSRAPVPSTTTTMTTTVGDLADAIDPQLLFDHAFGDTAAGWDLSGQTDEPAVAAGHQYYTADFDPDFRDANGTPPLTDSSSMDDLFPDDAGDFPQLGFSGAADIFADYPSFYPDPVGLGDSEDYSLLLLPEEPETGADPAATTDTDGDVSMGAFPHTPQYENQNSSQSAASMAGRPQEQHHRREGSDSGGGSGSPVTTHPLLTLPRLALPTAASSVSAAAARRPRVWQEIVPAPGRIGPEAFQMTPAEQLSFDLRSVVVVDDDDNNNRAAAAATAAEYQRRAGKIAELTARLRADMIDAQPRLKYQRTHQSQPKVMARPADYAQLPPEERDKIDAAVRLTEQARKTYDRDRNNDAAKEVKKRNDEWKAEARGRMNAMAMELRFWQTEAVRRGAAGDEWGRVDQAVKDALTVPPAEWDEIERRSKADQQRENRRRYKQQEAVAKQQQEAATEARNGSSSGRLPRRSIMIQTLASNPTASRAATRAMTRAATLAPLVPVAAPSPPTTARLLSGGGAGLSSSSPSAASTTSPAAFPRGRSEGAPAPSWAATRLDHFLRSRPRRSQGTLVSSSGAPVGDSRPAKRGRQE